MSDTISSHFQNIFIKSGLWHENQGDDIITKSWKIIIMYLEILPISSKSSYKLDIRTKDHSSISFSPISLYLSNSISLLALAFGAKKGPTTTTMATILHHLHLFIYSSSFSEEENNSDEGNNHRKTATAATGPHRPPLSNISDLAEIWLESTPWLPLNSNSNSTKKRHRKTTLLAIFLSKGNFLENFWWASGQIFGDHEHYIWHVTYLSITPWSSFPTNVSQFKSQKSLVRSRFLIRTVFLTNPNTFPNLFLTNQRPLSVV